MTKGHVPSNLKEHNRRSVYALLRSEGEVSKAEIGRRTDISAPTVGKIIDYFKEIGIVAEAGEGVSSLGRKPHLLRYTPDAAYAIGAEFDGLHLQIGIVDLSGRVAAVSTVRVVHDVRTLLSEAFVPAARGIIRESGIHGDLIKGIGLGLPGVVGKDGAGRRTLRYAPFVGVEEQFDLTESLSLLERELSLPVFVENDANAAALGEYAARSFGDAEDLLYVEVGRGLGAGIILEGKLRKGADAFAGELGYLVFDLDFQAERGQPGWLESRLALGDFWAETARDGRPSERAILRVGEHLAVALANVCVSFDIRNVVVGGAGLSPFGPELVGAVRNRLSRLSVIDIVCETPTAPAPGISGAAALAAAGWLERVFAG